MSGEHLGPNETSSVNNDSNFIKTPVGTMRIKQEVNDSHPPPLPNLSTEGNVKVHIYKLYKFNLVFNYI